MSFAYPPRSKGKVTPINATSTDISFPRVSAGSTTKFMSRSRIFSFSSEFCRCFTDNESSNRLKGDLSTINLRSEPMREQAVAQTVYDDLEFSAAAHDASRVPQESLCLMSPLRFLRSAYYNNVGLISYEMGERRFATLPALALARFNVCCGNSGLHTGFGSESG